jgi:hypothetical protein
MAVMAVLAAAAKGLQHHAWLLVVIGRGVRGYLDGWAIDIDHGFGLIERAKIALAFGLPLLALGLGGWCETGHWDHGCGAVGHAVRCMAAGPGWLVGRAQRRC